MDIKRFIKESEQGVYDLKELCQCRSFLGIPAVCVGGGAHTREEWVEKQAMLHRPEKRHQNRNNVKQKHLNI